MFSTLSGGKRYPGSISHRHKNVTFGKIAIGVAKGTAMIVIGVPVCTIAAGIGATAIVAYGLASPFYYGGKKLVRKIRRHRVQKKEELLRTAECCCCPDKLTREDILIWLENCEDEADYYSVAQDDIPLTGSSGGGSGGSRGGCGSSTFASASSDAGTSDHLVSGAGCQRRKPTLRRLFSRDSRGFLKRDEDPATAGGEEAGCCPQGIRRQRLEDRQGTQQQRQQQPQLQPHCHRVQQYSELISEPDSSCDEAEQADMWREMESVVGRLREDRLSICLENVVTMEQPLLLTDGKDVLQFIKQLQLDGHLGQLTKASSLPNMQLGVMSHAASADEEDQDKLGSLPNSNCPEEPHTQPLQQRQQRQRARKYKRTVSEGCGMTHRQRVALADEAGGAAAIKH